MTAFIKLRRASLLAVGLTVSACDIVELATNPAPRFEQQWNLPADSTVISVGTLLPPSVSIYSTPGSSPADSSAFQLAMNLAPISRRVGDDCAQCQAMDGQTTIKPAFVLSSGSTTALPADVISGSLVGGQVDVQVTNTLSFDPIRVKTGPGAQGYMLLVHRITRHPARTAAANEAQVALSARAGLYANRVEGQLACPPHF